MSLMTIGKSKINAKVIILYKLPIFRVLDTYSIKASNYENSCSKMS